MDARPRRLRGLDRIRLLGLEVPVASTLLSRLLGLAFLSRRRAGPGLLIPHCRSVHTFGTRFRLDLIFIDRDGRVVEIRRDVPSRRLLCCPRADAVLELPAHPTEAELALGCQLTGHPNERWDDG